MNGAHTPYLINFNNSNLFRNPPDLPQASLQSNSIQTQWQFQRAPPPQRQPQQLFQWTKQSERGAILTEQRLRRNSKMNHPRTTPVPSRILEDCDIESQPGFSGWTPSDAFLNIYNVRISIGSTKLDFSGFNQLFDKSFGAFHVGLELYGVEWQYGWCQEGSGICNAAPRGNMEHSYYKSLYLGRSDIDSNDFDQMLRNQADQWLGHEYNIASKNCIHFAQKLTELLGLDELPEWLIRLSSMLPTSLNMVGSGSSAVPSSTASSTVNV